MGCHRRLCLARLLSRYGCGLVTVFENIFVRRCQLHSVPPFSRHQTITFKLPSAQTRVGLFFCSVPTHKKHPHLKQTISLRFKNFQHPLCSRNIGHNLSVPHPSVAPTFAPLAERLASFVSSFVLKTKLIPSYSN